MPQHWSWKGLWAVDMAIVKMKKLRLMVIRSEKDRLLRDLERLGCVEFSELDEDLAEAGLVQENADA